METKQKPLKAIIEDVEINFTLNGKKASYKGEKALVVIEAIQHEQPCDYIDDANETVACTVTKTAFRRILLTMDEIPLSE